MQGRDVGGRERLLSDARTLEEAGAYALVLEAIPMDIAREITESLSIPTIGIGAGAGCNGQVLVWHDLLGIYEGSVPRFVKRYADLADEIGNALAEYVADVRSGSFPEERHTYTIPDDELAQFEAALGERKR